jgi:hypothetical protein
MRGSLKENKSCCFFSGLNIILRPMIKFIFPAESIRGFKFFLLKSSKNKQSRTNIIILPKTFITARPRPQYQGFIYSGRGRCKITSTSMTSSLKNILEKLLRYMYGQVILNASSHWYIPHSITLLLHRVVARGISPGAPACRDSVRTKVSLLRWNSSGDPYAILPIIHGYKPVGDRDHEVLGMG